MHSHLAQMIGTLILESRQTQRISQKDLAKQLGFSAQFLGQVEAGRYMIPDDALKNAIRILDLPQAKVEKIFRIASTENVASLYEGMKDVQKNRKR